MSTAAGLRVALEAKRFGGRDVLGEIEFTLARDERAALLGPSGIGKSTLLGVISGLDTAFEGVVERPQGRIAVVFQEPRLLPWRTLAQNIAVVPGAGDLQRARRLLGEVGLAEAADAFPETVSLGMQRRASLARAMAIEPALILLDEPLASLDPTTAAAMRDLLLAAFDRTRASVLMTTHDRRDAVVLSDRVMELGGTPARLVADRRSPLSRADRAEPERVEALCRTWFAQA